MLKAVCIQALPQLWKMRATAVAVVLLQQREVGAAAAARQGLSLGEVMPGRTQQQHAGSSKSPRTIW
jgi:hypothetical protein